MLAQAKFDKLDRNLDLAHSPGFALCHCSYRPLVTVKGKVTSLLIRLFIIIIVIILIVIKPILMLLQDERLSFSEATLVCKFVYLVTPSIHLPPITGAP